MLSKTSAAAVAAAGVLAVGGIAACGGGSSGGSSAASSSSSSSSSSPAAAQPVAQISDLTGVHTQVALDSGFLKAAKQLKLALGVSGSAKVSKAGVLTFPITGGSATYYTPGSRSPYVTGLINHDGSGITLTAGNKKVGLSNFAVNPGTSQLSGKVTLNGKTVASSTQLFFLDGKTLQPLQENGAKTKAILQGTKVYLDGPAASLLDKTFGLKAGTLSSKTLVGVATITLAVPSS
jgi:hypothetical protein